MPKKHPRRSKNWGGARPGAGRPRRTADVAVAPISTPAEAVDEPIENVETVAAAHAMNALAALVRQLTLGKSEPAKIVAANAILDRALGGRQSTPAETRCCHSTPRRVPVRRRPRRGVKRENMPAWRSKRWLQSPLRRE